MPRGDGRNPRFRVLCKRCNSYARTRVEIVMNPDLIEPEREVPSLRITCDCRNIADSFEEEFSLP